MAIDRILINGKIYTSNEDALWAEALVISGKTLAYVGDNETAKAMAEEGTEIIDLEGKTIIPGIIDWLKERSK